MKILAPNAIAFFENHPSEQDCLRFLEQTRWNGQPICPHCGSMRITRTTLEVRHHCNKCNTYFSATVNTIFHRSHVPLTKWFYAIFLLYSKNGKVTIRELADGLEVNKNTAWRIRYQIIDATDPEQQRILQSLILWELE